MRLPYNQVRAEYAREMPWRQPQRWDRTRVLISRMVRNKSGRSLLICRFVIMI
jgi:hypothetical protein